MGHDSAGARRALERREPQGPLADLISSQELSVLRGVAASPRLTEDLALALLNRRDLPPQVLEDLSRNGAAMRHRKVMMAVVSHPRTPLRTDRLRALNVPRQVAVSLGSDGLPREVHEFEVARRIAAVGEVWRVDDEWWRALIARRYIEVLLEGGKHAMLFEDLVNHEWFLQDI